MRKVFVNSTRPARLALGAVVAIVMAAAASADAPEISTSVVTFEEQIVAPGQVPVATNGYRAVEDVNRCAFSITFSGQHVRTDTRFDDGDLRSHIDQTVARQANGHAADETDMIEVFVSHENPGTWKITGRFRQVFLDGRLITLISGQLSVNNGTVLVDPHPGPMGSLPDICALLSE